LNDARDAAHIMANVNPPEFHLVVDRALDGS